ncbi:MAG: T9SS type A sorting domain-containing protein [Chitinophagaceae bacterium]
MKSLILAFFLLLLPVSVLLAQDAGFFLSDWQPKNITAPLYNEAAKPTAAVQTTVTVSTASTVNKVSRYLFGNNCNPYMTQMVTEATLLDHIKNLAPNVIRAPGGSLSDIYFFNAADGQPPADAPDTLLDGDGKKYKVGYWYGKNTASWTMAIASYYSMLQQTNNTGIITVNYGYARYGTGPSPVQAAAHLAAEWVRYDNGRTKFWEIGNESAGSWEAGYRIDLTKNKDGQPEFISGELYGQHFKIFADSMRKAAAEIGATIKIGAQLIQSDATYSYNVIDRNWNSGYFAKAANYADFYIIHSYYTPYNENSTATAILNTAATETRNMMNFVKTAIASGGVELKPIALTEWNIFAVGSKQMVSHVNGLHADLVLGELIQNKYGEASRWDLANGWSNGDDHGTFSQGDEPDGIAKWTPRPVFYHMYYFQKFFGDQMVASTVSGSTDVVAYGSTFTSGQAGVVLVNKGTAAQVVKINFQDFYPGNRYYWYTLTGSTDNGEFSRKVLVNDLGPSGAAGGPANYTDIKANSALANNDVRITLPARAAVFVLVEKSSVTATADLDPSNRMVRISPNPSVNGNFIISFNGFTPADLLQVNLYQVNGQLVAQYAVKNKSTLSVNRYLKKGVYMVQVISSKGTTVKKLVVQ